MLGRLLRNVLRLEQDTAPEVMSPAVLRIAQLDAAHARSPLQRHLEILFGERILARRPLLGLVDEALVRTDTPVAPFMVFARRQAVLNLLAYFTYARGLPGRWAECGVFKGFSALVLCLAARSLEPAFDGSGFHLVDSFQGLSEPTEEDRLPDAQGASRLPAFKGSGHFRVSQDSVRSALAEFPGVRLHSGWIPQVLETLPPTPWSFVHIDVDLYEPTLACLEHFLPRLAPGGVIVCDDYGSLVFPGARRAWDEVCARDDIPFVQLPTGQSVILKDL